MSEPDKETWDTRLVQARGLLDQAHELLAEMYRELPIGARVGGVMVSNAVAGARVDAFSALETVKKLVDL